MWTVNIKHVCFMCTFAHNFISKGSSEQYNFQFFNNTLDWKNANERCSDLHGTLTSVKDLETVSNNEDSLRIAADTPFWSSVTGSFTPWIVYRGCFPQPSWNSINFTLKPNSVGNCFSKCRNQTSNPTGCEYFALSGETCFCFCTYSAGLKLTDSVKCNLTCNNSTDDGFCGGNDYITLYQVNDTFKGDGFCLAFDCQSKELLSSGHDCDEKNEGFCVKGKDELIPNQLNSTWNDYARSCKEQKRFLTAYIQAKINQTVCNGYVWTGIRTYRIYRHDGNKDCFAIRRKLDLWLYEKVNCFHELPFVCQTNLIQTESTISMPPNTNPIVNQNQTSAITPSLLKKTSQSTNTGLIAGSVSGVVILVIATVLSICYIKRKQKPRSSTAPPVHNAIYDIVDSDNAVKGQNDVVYMNAVSQDTNQQEQFHFYKENNVYVEKTEGEYDCLRSSRPKPRKTDDDPQYDQSENAYSTTTRKKQDVEMHGSHYDSVSTENPYNSKDNHDNMHGSHYSSTAGNQYNLKYNENNILELSHYDTTLH